LPITAPLTVEPSAGPITARPQVTPVPPAPSIWAIAGRLSRVQYWAFAVLGLLLPLGIYEYLLFENVQRLYVMLYL